MKTKTTQDTSTPKPGTWHAWPERKSGRWIVSVTQNGTNNELVIAECHEEIKANLIAAAPDLLEALESLFRVGPSGIIGQQFARDKALEAINKATQGAK